MFDTISSRSVQVRYQTKSTNSWQGPQLLPLLAQVISQQVDEATSVRMYQDERACSWQDSNRPTNAVNINMTGSELQRSPFFVAQMKIHPATTDLSVIADPFLMLSAYDRLEDVHVTLVI